MASLSVSKKQYRKMNQSFTQKTCILNLNMIKDRLKAFDSTKQYTLTFINYYKAAEMSILKHFTASPPDESKKIQEKYKEEVATNQTIEFIGVETNVCILANIMVIQNIFPQANITVDKNLVGSSNTDLHNKTLDVLENMNVIIK